jgi:hypothetical protein
VFCFDGGRKFFAMWWRIVFGNLSI